MLVTDALTGTPIHVETDGQIITRLEVAPDAPPGLVIAPTLFDPQINGALGVDFSDPTITIAQVRRVVDWLMADGVGGFLPTLVTGPPERTEAALRNLVELRQANEPFARMVPGFHLEGPFISPRDGPRGAHPVEHCRDPDWGLFTRFQAAANGGIKLVTLAPELPGTTEFIAHLVANHVRVALGHTAATAEAIHAAVDAGATLSTHLGNGLAATMDRHRNPLWPQLADERLAVSIIADGAHLPDDMLKCIARLKRGKLVSTCDASPLAGLPPGDYPLWGQPVTIDAAGVPRVPGTGYLAGSGRGPRHCLRHLVRSGTLSLAEAVTAASVTPRQLLGLAVPRLAIGARWRDFCPFQVD